jgi:Ca-activated chloride channel family protein
MIANGPLSRDMRKSEGLFPTLKTPTLLTCILAGVLRSQDGAAFHSSVEIVLVPCTVVNENGVAVTDLAKDEFRVYDNGVRRPIKNLWVDANLPVTIGVIIDASESQKENIAEHRQTVKELLARILRPGDRAFVISVEEESRLWVDLTDSADEIRTRLAGTPGNPIGAPCPGRESKIPGLGPSSTCGSSPLWNAVYDAARIKLQGLTGNKALLILTDGFDSGSTHTWNQAADAVIRADASLYAIQYRSDFGTSLAPDLYRLIGETGGTRFAPPHGDYSSIISRIQTDLRQRYVLGFWPEKFSGKARHELRIEATRPELLVRARKTYFIDPR